MWWKILCFLIYTLQKNTFASILTNLNPCCNLTSPDSITVSANDVIFTLYNAKYPDGKTITGNDNSINNTQVTWFITQGFLENSTTFPWVITMKDNYRALYPNSSVIIVNWFEISQNIDYFYVTCQVPGVANLLAQLIKALTDNGKDPKLIHLIGFSLGAQISGLAGQAYFDLTGNKVQYITGLDAAGPCYTVPTVISETQRISPGDAKYVEGIHTNQFVLGTHEPIGHVDFVFNGGTLQPGCPSFKLDFGIELGLIYLVACPHEKAPEYWNDLLTGTKFEACNILLTPPSITLEETNTNYNGIYFIET